MRRAILGFEGILIFSLVEAEAWLLDNNAAKLEFFEHVGTRIFSCLGLFMLNFLRFSVAIRLLLDLVMISLGIICRRISFVLRDPLILLDALLASIWACTPAHYVRERFALLGPALLLIGVHVHMRTLYPIATDISLASTILLIGSQADRADAGAAVAHDSHHLLLDLIRLILVEGARWWCLSLLLGSI